MFFKNKKHKDLPAIVQLGCRVVRDEWAKAGKSGITLIETIVSLGVLTIALFPTSALIIRSINFSRQSQQMVVVVNLAREGIEIARSIRDLNGFDSLSVGNKIIGANYINNNLEINNADNSNIASCSNCVLELYNSRYYHNSPGADTDFKRMLVISDESSYEKKIISQVYWTEHGNAHTFKIETHLTDW